MICIIRFLPWSYSAPAVFVTFSNENWKKNLSVRLFLTNVAPFDIKLRITSMKTNQKAKYVRNTPSPFHYHVKNNIQSGWKLA